MKISNVSWAFPLERSLINILTASHIMSDNSNKRFPSETPNIIYDWLSRDDAGEFF